MKRKKRTIIFSFLLLANLLFSQIGANFLHLDESHLTGVSQKKEINKVVIDATKEKCAICSLHLINALFYEEAVHVPLLSVIKSFVITIFVSFKTEFVIFSTGRAPPIF